MKIVSKFSDGHEALIRILNQSINLQQERLETAKIKLAKTQQFVKDQQAKSWIKRFFANYDYADDWDRWKVNAITGNIKTLKRILEFTEWKVEIVLNQDECNLLNLKD